VIQSFWPKFRRAVKATKPDAYIVGEIWDDASPWLQGDQFDAVMNYRFQKALIAYFGAEDIDTCAFARTLRDLFLAYPEPATAVMLNLLGSHDTARPMTVVRRRDQGRALESLKLMVAMQFTYAGAPCIYYGDEIGLEGDKDPDCRRCYPWGWELTGGRKGTEVGAAGLLQEAHRRAQGQPRAPPGCVPPAGGGPRPADLRLRATNPR
jgi:glycosidase